MGTQAAGECFRSFFEFSKAFTSVSIMHRDVRTHRKCALEVQTK